MRYFLATLSSVALANNPVVIDFNDACVTKESIETKKGGMLENIDMWIQGLWMKYTHNDDKNSIEASGKLRVEYHGQLFIGEKFEYDFRAKTGVIFGGRTHCGAFYVYGDKIFLDADGRFTIIHARLTTCESSNPSWQIKAKSLVLTDDYLVQAKDVIFKLARLPMLWLPKMRANLDTLPKSPFEYQFSWKSMGGPRMTFKYQVFSWKHSRAHVRLDYRFRRGPGFGIESHYDDPNKQTSFISNSYIARDRTIINRKNKGRYRAEGIFEQTSETHSRYARLTYDKLSDEQMPYDYPRDTFDLPSPKPTRLTTHTFVGKAVLSIIANAKVNRFETVKQEYPTFRLDVLPLQVGNTNLLITTPLEIGFLDYRFASRWKGTLSNFSSLRIYVHPRLQYATKLWPICIKAEAEPIYLYYTTNANERHISVRLLHTTAEASIPFIKRYAKAAHSIAPFVKHEYYSTPSRTVATHDVFDLKDAYARIGLLNVGLKTSLARPHACGTEFLQAEAFFQNLWETKTYDMHFSRFAFDLSWQRPNLYAGSGAAWNRAYNHFEDINGWIEWTVSDHLAMALEMRYRSRYAWRKLDKSRFFLETDHTTDELIASPLSDERSTAITNIAYRLSPTWRMHFRSRHCWDRIGERVLNDFRLDLRKYLTCNLEIGGYIQHTEANKIKVGFSLSASRYPLRPKMHVKKFKPSW